MPIPLPDLDDRTFADLVEETRALIPRYAPAWTDHNVSDPGIMLIELFAWLTEALIYRLNRIPEASEARLLEFLGAVFHPAWPATVKLAVTADGLEEGSLIVPQSTPLTASSGGASATLAFETVHDLRLTPESPGGTVEARQTTLVRDERLGVSDGQAHQVFQLTQPFLALDLNGTYPTVPQVTVGGVAWTYASSLLDSTAKDRRFTVEPRLNAIRFGDGHLGRIPPEGVEIVASYRYTLGQEGNLPAGSEFEIDVQSARLAPAVKEAIARGVSFPPAYCEAEATGGADPTGLDEARDQATSALKRRWRAVTAKDFEELVLGEELEQLIFGTYELKLARARCLPELDLAAPDPDTPHRGHVSVIVVPCSEDEAGNRKPEEPSSELMAEVWKFLDQRRLITCRHHVMGPGYTDLWVKATVACLPRVVPDQVEKRIKISLKTFFDPLRGGPHPDGKGWPLGRDVYASEVHAIIEGTPGVDHVESLVLCTGDGDGDERDAGDRIVVALNNLVRFDAQSSQIEVWAGRLSQ